MTDKPWSEGGKEEFLAKGGITMTHDELAAAMGDSYQKMLDAGFVMIPKSWRDSVMKVLSEKGVIGA